MGHIQMYYQWRESSILVIDIPPDTPRMSKIMSQEKTVRFLNHEQILLNFACYLQVKIAKKKTFSDSKIQ